LASSWAGQPELETLVTALLKVRATICTQIASLDEGLQRIANGSATVRRLMTVPGIGPVTALAFASAIDDPSRFRKASSVGAYFGLTPRRYQSGEIDRPGRLDVAVPDHGQNLGPAGTTRVSLTRHARLQNILREQQWMARRLDGTLGLSGAVRLIEVSATRRSGRYRCLVKVLHSPSRAPVYRTARSVLHVPAR
jgi:hypothetical protein